MVVGSSNGYLKVSSKSNDGLIKAMRKRELQLEAQGGEAKDERSRGAQKKNFACLIT